MLMSNLLNSNWISLLQETPLHPFNQKNCPRVPKKSGPWTATDLHFSADFAKEHHLNDLLGWLRISHWQKEVPLYQHLFYIMPIEEDAKFAIQGCLPHFCHQHHSSQVHLVFYMTPSILSQVHFTLGISPLINS